MPRCNTPPKVESPQRHCPERQAAHSFGRGGMRWLKVRRMWFAGCTRHDRGEDMVARVGVGSGRHPSGVVATPKHMHNSAHLKLWDRGSALPAGRRSARHGSSRLGHPVLLPKLVPGVASVVKKEGISLLSLPLPSRLLLFIRPFSVACSYKHHPVVACSVPIPSRSLACPCTPLYHQYRDHYQHHHRPPR